MIMKMEPDKQRIIKYLLGIAVFLLIVRATLDIFMGKDEPGTHSPEPAEATVKSVEDDFRFILDDFAVAAEWVNKKKISHYDSVSYIYKVSLPADLPAAVILNEANYVYSRYPLIVTSKEQGINGVTTMRVVNSGKDMLVAEFTTDKNISRQAPELGFILNDFESLGSDEMEKLLSLPENFAVLLTATTNGEKLRPKVLSRKKEFMLLLNDDITEVKFRFDEDYTEKRLRTSAREILASFGDAEMFLIDDQSDLYKSVPFKSGRKEFESRGIELIPVNSFVTIKQGNDESLDSVFEYYCKSSVTTGKKIFLISADDFMSIKETIEKLRKKGFKFIFPSVISEHSTPQ